MPTRPELNDTDWDVDVWRTYFYASRELIAALDRRLQADSGISHPEYLVLLALRELPEKAMRIGQLADRLAWEKSRVSHQVTRMSARGFVERRLDPDDGRGVWIVLTEEGERSYYAARRDHGEAIREWFLDVMTEEEKKVVHEVSSRVRSTISNPPIVAAPASDAD